LWPLDTSARCVYLGPRPFGGARAVELRATRDAGAHAQSPLQPSHTLRGKKKRPGREGHNRPVTQPRLYPADLSQSNFRTDVLPVKSFERTQGGCESEA